MDNITIYHNPRCSKSRQTLALIRDRGIEPQIIHYLDTPPTAEVLAEIVRKLGKTPLEIARKGEEAFKTYFADADNLDEAALISLMTQHPKVIERPIVVRAEQAIIGRPPEQVFHLLD